MSLSGTKEYGIGVRHLSMQSFLLNLQIISKLMIIKGPKNANPSYRQVYLDLEPLTYIKTLQNPLKYGMSGVYFFYNRTDRTSEVRLRYVLATSSLSWRGPPCCLLTAQPYQVGLGALLRGAHKSAEQDRQIWRQQRVQTRFQVTPSKVETFFTC